MAYFDSVLKDSTFIAGEHFSMADITLFAGLGFAEFAKIGVPETLEHLINWKQHVASRPSIAG